MNRHRHATNKQQDRYSQNLIRPPQAQLTLRTECLATGEANLNHRRLAPHQTPRRPVPPPHCHFCQHVVGASGYLPHAHPHPHSSQTAIPARPRAAWSFSAIATLSCVPIASDKSLLLVAACFATLVPFYWISRTICVVATTWAGGGWAGAGCGNCGDSISLQKQRYCVHRTCLWYTSTRVSNLISACFLKIRQKTRPQIFLVTTMPTHNSNTAHTGTSLLQGNGGGNAIQKCRYTWGSRPQA